MFKYLNISIFKYRDRKAIASLPAILLMGAIIVEIGVAGVFLISYLNNSVYGTRLSSQALLAAQSGVNDAVWRLMLNKNCGSDLSCAPIYPDTYSITVGDTTADISICKDSCIIGKTQITAVGHAFTKQHRVVAIVNIDPSTLVTVESIKDQPE
jgi:hypothetical protein